MMSTLDDDHMIQFMNFRKHVSISGTVSNDLSTKRYFEKEKKFVRWLVIINDWIN